jgi:putative oxidoreductase
MPSWFIQACIHTGVSTLVYVGLVFRKLFSTGSDVSLTVLRLALGVVFFAHGAQKMLGWFGGAGFSRTMAGMTGFMHIPAPLAVLPILAEFFGGLGLLLGLLTRIAAFGLLCDMVVAVFLVHLQNGFFMNWGGQQKGEGFEFHILAIAMLLVTMIRGAGAASLDRFLMNSPARA